MTRTPYLETPSHHQCAMQFKLSNSSCSGGRKQSFRIQLLQFFFLKSCLTSFYGQVLPKVTKYSDWANIVQIQCLQLFNDHKVKAH